MFRRPPKLSQDLTSPVFRVNPLAANAAKAASLPTKISPILIANLQFSLFSAFGNQPFIVDLGSRAARVPLPYAICLTLSDVDGPLRPLSARLERILEPRPTLFVGVISGDLDLSRTLEPMESLTPQQCVLTNNTLTFWAAPDSFEPNGFARLLLTVTDHDYNDYEVPIDIKAVPVSPSISVQAPGYPHRQLRTETNLTFKEHEKESDVLITVWNETENNSPLLVNAVVEESCSGAFSIGESYGDSKICIPLIIEGGKSCTFYARFEMKPELTVRKCYYGSVLIKYAAALPAEGTPGQDQELHQFYDHVLNLRAEGGGKSCQEQHSPHWKNSDTSRRILVDDECVCSDIEEHGDRACILFEEPKILERDALPESIEPFDSALPTGNPLRVPQSSAVSEELAFEKSYLSDDASSKLTYNKEAEASLHITADLLVDSVPNVSSLDATVVDHSASDPSKIVSNHEEHIDQKSVCDVIGFPDKDQSLSPLRSHVPTESVSPANPRVPGALVVPDEASLCDVSMLAEVSTLVRESEAKNGGNQFESRTELPASDFSDFDAKVSTKCGSQDDDVSNFRALPTELSVDSASLNVCCSETPLQEVGGIDHAGTQKDSVTFAGSPGTSCQEKSDRRNSLVKSLGVEVEVAEKSIALKEPVSFLNGSEENSSIGVKDAISHELSDGDQKLTVRDYTWNSEWKIGSDSRYYDDIARAKQDVSGREIPTQSSQVLEGPAPNLNSSHLRGDNTAAELETATESLTAVKRPKLKMPRRIREGGILVEANSGSVEFPVLNACSEVVEVTIFVERVKGNGDDKCHVNVTPNYVVLAAHGTAILTMTRISAQGGEYHVLLRGSTLGPQPKKRSYRIPMHVAPSAMRLESNEEFAVDRPTMSFYNPTDEGREWNIRIRNGTQRAARYNAWIGQGCGELLNSNGNPAFQIVGSASGSIDPQKFARVRVEFVGGEGVRHFHGRLYFNVGSQQDFIPLFGYVGGSDVRLMTNDLGYVIVQNVGERAGFVVMTGPECDPVHDQSVRAVLAPKEEREFVAPYGTGSVVYTGDEIARTRACRAENIERARADGEYESSRCEIGDNIFEGEFDGEEAAMQSEMLDWAAEDRFSMFYSGRLFDYAVHRYLFDLNDETIRFMETSRTARGGWSAVAKDGYVHIENLNVAKELSFEATGAEPCKGVIGAFGDAMLAPFREVVEVRAEGKIQTVTVQLQGQE